MNRKPLIAFAPETGAGAGADSGAAEAPPPASRHDASYGGLVTTPEAPGSADPAQNQADPATPPASDPASGNDQQPPEKAETKSYQPEGLPDDLLGANDQETIDKMLAAQSKNAAPETPADYKFEFDQKLKDSFPGNPADDPALIGWSDIAHKHGLSNEAANSIITEVMNDWLDKGLVAKPVSPDEFWNALAENGGGAASGQKRVNEAATFVQGLENSHVLTAQQKISLTNFATAAPENVAIIEALKGAMAGHGVQTGGDPSVPTAFTKDDLARRRSDPRNDSQNHANYDPKYRAETDRLAKSLLKTES